MLPGENGGGRSDFVQIDEMDTKSLLKPHVPLLVVSNAEGSGPNVMTAAWWMLAGYEPFRYLLSIDHHTYTYELVEANPEFVLAVPTAAMLDVVAFCGTESGRDVDKIERLGLELADGRAVDVPRLVDALGTIECRVDESFEFGNNTYYFGEVVAADARRDALDGRILDPAAGPLAYMGSDRDADGRKWRYALEYDGALRRRADDEPTGDGE